MMDYDRGPRTQKVKLEEKEKEKLEKICGPASPIYEGTHPREKGPSSSPSMESVEEPLLTNCSASLDVNER